MFRTSSLSVATVCLLSALSTHALGAQSRSSRPNDIGVELGGKAVLYSFSYQRMVSPSVGVQGGLEILAGNFVPATAVAVPLGGKFYFLSGNASPYVTAGVVLVSASIESGPVEASFYGNAGGGFEYRGTGGFLIRGALYTLIASGDVVVWPGLHIGIAF